MAQPCERREPLQPLDERHLVGHVVAAVDVQGDDAEVGLQPRMYGSSW
ncbi:hypothetical protein JYT28_01290 [Desulfobulbus sp. AH-315-M07]|nr:hypothetical protein [Desulfobulbus sp. AH-315-M07]